MTKKKLLGIAAAGAVAAIGVYLFKRNKSKVMAEVKKTGGKLRRHMTNVFHDAKTGMQERLAEA
jgi:hypothetical protein